MAHRTQTELWKTLADMSTYPAPDTVPKTIQITNPIKQTTESILHPWDWRRGLIKTSALKRMYQHLETDTDFECSAEEGPQKKKKRLGAALRDPEEEVKKIQDCLHSLCEKKYLPRNTRNNPRPHQAAAAAAAAPSSTTSSE